MVVTRLTRARSACAWRKASSASSACFLSTAMLRYQIYPGWKDSNGRQALFDVATGNIVIPDASAGKVSPLMPTGYVNVVTASKAGYSGDTLTTPDKNNFAPRLSVAWR